MRLFWFIVCLLMAAPSFAQVDIERLRQDGIDGWSGSVVADFTLRNGNVDLVEVGPSVSVMYARLKDQVIVIGSGDLGWEGGERFSNEMLAHVRYVRSVSEVLQIEGFTQTNFDKSRQLDARWVGGVGVRVRLASTEGSRLRVGSSVMGEHERNAVTPTTVHAEKTTVARWSNYISVALRLSDTATFSGTAYYQPDFSAFDDARLLLDGRLSVSVTESVGLISGISIRRDSDPVDTVAETDFQLSSGLEVAW